MLTVHLAATSAGNMEIFALLFGFLPCAVFCISNNSNIEPAANFTDGNKEMYVIDAVVYRVGILTNETDDTTNDNTTGSQEAITYFHTNGSNINLSEIPKPLMTNVTAQSLFGVAPIPINEGIPQAWSTLDNLTDNQEELIENSDNSAQNGGAGKLFFKRSTGLDENTTVKIVKGSAVIPQGAGVRSLLVPPLLLFNNNLTPIPVPIPNTSVVHYAEVNTLVDMP